MGSGPGRVGKRNLPWPDHGTEIESEFQRCRDGSERSHSYAPRTISSSPACCGTQPRTSLILSARATTEAGSPGRGGASRTSNEEPETWRTMSITWRTE